MKINPRYYPVIIITAYVVFLLLGYGPERGGEGSGHGLLLTMETFV